MTNATPSTEGPSPLPFLARAMNRLTYPQKFALISAVFLLPIALLLFFFNAEKNDLIDFAAKELIGTTYATPLHDMLVLSDEARLAALDFTGGQEAKRPELVRSITQMDQAFTRLTALDARYGPALKTEVLFKNLTMNWNYLRTQILTNKVEQPSELFLELSSDLRELITQVANNSNLTLDPDLNTYYLMDITCFKWPNLQSTLSNTWFLTRTALLRHQMIPQERAELISGLGVLRALKRDLSSDLAVVFDNDPNQSVKKALAQPSQTSTQELENYDGFLQKNLLSGEKPTATYDELNLAASRTLSASNELWGKSIESLNGLIKERITRFEHQRNMVWALVGLLILVAAILFTAFYSNVMRTVQHIQAAVGRMQNGDYHTRLLMESRDELGQVISSFNSVLDRLHHEYLQVKEESARAAQAELREQENAARFRGIFENSVEGMFQTSLDGQYLAANLALAKLYGYESAEELMRGIKNIGEGLYVLPGRRAEFQKILEKEEVIKDFVSEIYRRDGKKIWISENARLIRDAEGNPKCYEGLVIDITYRKQIDLVRQEVETEMRRAKEYAERASNAKTDFLSNMSHELRTPLNGILGYAQILKKNSNLPEKTMTGLNIIHQSAEHLLTLINDILDLSKIEARRIELVNKEFDLRDFLTTLCGMFHVRAEQKKISFHEHYSSDLPNVVIADEKRLRQIIINLIGNALKFTDKGGVSLSVSRQGKAIRFKIEDTGIGIPDNKIDELFKAFSQVSDASRNAEGTGLGLALSQRLVELMGGSIRVQSEAGKGSRFWFDLELPESNSTITPIKEQAREITGYLGPRRKILAVDDKWENRSVMVDMLAPLGFEMVEAENGQKALELLEETSVDLVLTDLVMPVIDGFEMTRRLRKIARFEKTPVITISASVFDLNSEKCQAAGCNDFLGKPVNMLELLACLKRHLELEWVFQENIVKEPSVVTSSSNTDQSLLDPPITEMPDIPQSFAVLLLDLAKRGDVARLREASEGLLKNNSSYHPFHQRLCFLADNFKMKQIRQLIQQHTSLS